MADAIIIPNANPNLVMLHVWALRGEIEDTAEIPIIAWKISEEDYPFPVCVGCDPEENEAQGWMVYDRAAKIGHSGSENIHGREQCVETLRADILRRQRNAKGAK